MKSGKLNRASRVTALSRITIEDDSGPCPSSRSPSGYTYIAAERGDTAIVISRQEGIVLCAFERTRLVVEVTEQQIADL
jgi:hypothetical protein